MIDDKIMEIQDYMTVLLEAGFSVEEVLKRGVKYAEKHLVVASRHSSLTIAQIVRQAAKNLHIDAESQERAYYQSSPMEVK